MLDDSEFSLSFHPLMLMDDDTSHSLSILKKKREIYTCYTSLIRFHPGYF